MRMRRVDVTEVGSERVAIADERAGLVERVRELSDLLAAANKEQDRQREEIGRAHV